MFDETLSPAAEYLTVAEAASKLSVTEDMIRKFIAQDELSGFRMGNAWLIPRVAVETRLSLGSHRGRRLTPAHAWGLLFLAAGLPATWLDRNARWRMKRFLVDRGVSAMRTQLVDRGRPHSLRAHPSMLVRLRQDPTLMHTGATAASELRLGLVGVDKVEAYVGESRLEEVMRRYRLRPSREANVTLRVIPSFSDAWTGERFAPIPAIALDLLDDPDPRAQQVGRELLRKVASQRTPP